MIGTGLPPVIDPGADRPFPPAANGRVRTNCRAVQASEPQRQGREADLTRIED